MEYIVNAANKRVSSMFGKPVVKSASVATTTVAAAAPAMTKSSRTVETITEVVSQPQTTKLVDATLAIISTESGIAATELTDECNFDDIGMDSLLCLMVSSKLSEELAVELDSATFLELGTIANLKAFVQKLESPQHVATVNTTYTEQILDDTAVISTVVDLGGVDTAAVWDGIVNMISEESGVAKAELTDGAFFADIGIDSLLSLVIWSRMQDELELDLPQMSPFIEFDTLGSFKRYILGNQNPPALPADERIARSADSTTSSSPPATSLRSSSEEGRVSIDTPLSSEDVSSDIKEESTKGYFTNTPIQPAWPLVLQGSPKLATERLFLFPDGCGAATSYMRLPRISPSTAVIAFNSPFMK